MTMHHRRMTIAAALVAAFFVAAPAAAEMFCTEARALARFLADHHDETPIGAGLAGNGGLVQVLVSPDGETWTIILTMPDGTACLMAAGEGWESLDPAPVGPKT